jgi:hypothetical protein
MEFEQQKPITDDYRRGWERIYQQQEVRKQYANGCPILEDECHSPAKHSRDTSTPIDPS